MPAVMVEGESGILSVCPSWNRPVWEPSRKQLTWRNGAVALLYSADEPDRLRGPQCDLCWADELAAWKYPDDCWSMLMLGLRLGKDPRCIVTTTPRPIRIVKDLVSRDGKDVVVTRGRTAENRENLAPAFFQQIVSQYEGTRLGRQELEAQILEEIEGALWKRQLLDDLRVTSTPDDLHRIIVAIDPAASSGEDSDETGIIVAGVDHDREAYVLEDLSGRFQPMQWARRAIDAYRRHDADRNVAEVNNGGGMVEATLRQLDAKVSSKAVHASRGKAIRAEPVSALYEKAAVHHCGTFAQLEDQMCAFTGEPHRRGDSPDRLDALVWALSDLVINKSGSPFILSRDALTRVATMPARNRFGARHSRFPMRDRFVRWNPR
jgi:predicted phage terminase large subunit-like protein